MTLEEIMKAIQPATSPEEAAAIYFVTSIKDNIEFRKDLEKRFPDPPKVKELCDPFTYPTDEEIDSLKKTMIEHLPEGIQAYAEHPMELAKRSGFPLTTNFDPRSIMDQLIALARIAPDSNIKHFLPATTLRLLPTAVFSNQIIIWSKES